MSGDVALSAALILAAALLYSSVGHGGASGYLAVMALLGTPAEQMRPTALVLNVVVASIATIQFARAGHFRWRLFLPLAVASIPAAFAGGTLTLPGATYRFVVGGVLIVSAGRFMISVREPAADARPAPMLLLALTGAALGFLAGLTGVGGGIFLSPLLIWTGWAGLRMTAATSAPFILVNSIAGLLGQAGDVGALHPHVGWWMGAVLVGGLIGSRWGSVRLSSVGLRRALAAVLLIAGAKLLLG